MKSRRLGFLLLTGIASLLAAAVLPASLATASPISAVRVAVSTSPASAVTAHHVSGCGPQVTVYTPRTPGAALSGAALGLPTGPHSLLATAAQRHFRWLSTITCKASPAPPIPKKASGLAATKTYLNWAGYEDSPTSNPYYVQSSWQIPSVCCNYNGLDKSSIWPGLGDGNTGTIIQDGTEQDVSTSNVASYNFWYEAWPQPQQAITNLTAHPGDMASMSASYGTLASGTATFVVCNATQGTCAALSEPANPPDNHVEWIAERTAYCNSSTGNHYWFPALTSFSVAQFAGSYYDLTASGYPEYTISQGNPTAITMVDVKNNTLATPGPLDSSGAAFNVIWNDYGTPSEIQPVQTC